VFQRIQNETDPLPIQEPIAETHTIVVNLCQEKTETQKDEKEVVKES